jgi:hypothetical protein
MPLPIPGACLSPERCDVTYRPGVSVLLRAAEGDHRWDVPGLSRCASRVYALSRARCSRARCAPLLSVPELAVSHPVSSALLRAGVRLREDREEMKLRERSVKHHNTTKTLESLANVRRTGCKI